mgnify:CR=1 FL=1
MLPDSRCGNGVCGLYKTSNQRFRFDITVMCLYGVDDVCVLVIALAKIYADIDMRAFHLAVNRLADIMQQAGALCLCGIDDHSLCGNACVRAA